jgi:hypothetical protein
MRPFADVLEEIAEQAHVYDVVDAAVRGARRRKRARIVVRPLIAIAVVFALVTCAGLGLTGLRERFTSPGRPEPGPGRLAGDPPALVKPLLDAPTRGSLGRDQAFLDKLLDKVAGSPEDYGMPADRSRLDVLFAGDVPGGHRVALVASVVANPRYVQLEARRGADAAKLRLTGWSDVTEPVIRLESPPVPGQRGGYLVVFGPAGYDVSQSDSPRYFADGTVHRDWKPVPDDTFEFDYALDVPRGLRFRFSKGGKILYEDGVPTHKNLKATVDPAPLHGRGKPAPRAAQEAARALAYSTGLDGPDVHYVVLWSDDFDSRDPSYPNPSQIATVMALTADGGGPYITLAVDSKNPPEGRNHPTGQGILGDPDKGLIVMRPPYFSGSEPNYVQIVAPPSAVRAEALRNGKVVARTALVNGVGQMPLPAPSTLRFRVYDTSGALVAERPYEDVTGLANNSYYEPTIKGW